jgi:membrane fusion protein (multidrug efflux system)
MKPVSTKTIHQAGYSRLWWFILPVLLYYGCETAASKSNIPGQKHASLPVINVEARTATTYRKFSTSLEGTKDVEIRPQVSGYLEKIYVDEGAHVQKGQPLFKIDDKLYRQQLNNAEASLLAAKADLETAQINLAKLAPLVQHRVISDVQLREAQAARDAANASVAEATAVVGSARINLGYTLIKAPAEGYIGKLPFKQGSLVGKNTSEALTTLSAIGHVYAYFSMSEADFLAFKHQFAGETIEDKIKQMPPVDLVMADGSIYPEKGKVETVLGRFDKTMGTISFRAVFPNKNGLLRSGNTGEIKIPHLVKDDLVIPQTATFELQDKVFVFAVEKGNKVTSVPISVSAVSGHYYLISKGIQPGEKIVFTGLDRLRDGMVIQPQNISLDSLLQADPL